ncbi:hypothetical protein SAY86_018602 [Trapa natans]|uniref:Uncharacterized protein n=1 Tax=Trapa natans TaxID=22666 RepID=A0AAN7QY79_TRANT|nr:hypothetical protein SAY86_018602 [Trapa natans]
MDPLDLRFCRWHVGSTLLAGKQSMIKRGENARMLKLSMKDMKSGKKKHAEKLYNSDTTPPGTSNTSNPSTPTASSVIPFLSPVYNRVPTQFPDLEDCNKVRSPKAAAVGCDSTPRGDRCHSHKKSLSSGALSSLTKSHIRR